MSFFISVAMILSFVLTTSPDEVDSDKKVQEVKTVETVQGSGFIKNDTKKVKLLTDDKGKGEEVPTRMVELSTGLAAAQDIHSLPGFNLNGGFFYMFKKDYWLGASTGYQWAKLGGGQNQGLHQGDFNLEFRKYFMAHKQANRFVMAHVLVQLGYSRLQITGDSKLESNGLNTGIGFGFKVSLNVNWYLGFRFVYNFPLWGDLCRNYPGGGETCKDSADSSFYLSWLKVNLVLSYSF